MVVYITSMTVSELHAEGFKEPKLIITFVGKLISWYWILLRRNICPQSQALSWREKKDYITLLVRQPARKMGSSMKHFAKITCALHSDLWPRFFGGSISLPGFVSNISVLNTNDSSVCHFCKLVSSSLRRIFVTILQSLGFDLEMSDRRRHFI